MRGAAHQAQVNDIDTEFWIHDLLERMQDVFIAHPSVLLLQKCFLRAVALGGQTPSEPIICAQISLSPHAVGD